MTPDPANPFVFLVGAGPGSPGLLTVRGAEVLGRADLVLYDQLVPERLLDLAPPHAERLCVRDLPGNHPDKYPHIHKKLIEAASTGKTVVRLKGGDPLIFGRGGEEAEALRAAGLTYEIVPGVTAALAAGAYLEIPLTHRMYASSIALVTGHELPNKPGNKLDWKALAAFPGTLAIYMGIARLPVIVGELLKYGKPPDTPAAIIERASTGEQRSVSATLGNLEEARRHAGLEAPGLILVGDTVAHRAPQPWFENRPLFGQRVLVTRPAHQASGMVRKLELLGAVVSRLHAVEIRDRDDFTLVDRGLEQIRRGEWDWLVFTSANGVHALLRRLDAVGRDLRDLGRIKLAAIGPKTADVLREYRLRADVVPAANFSSEGLVEVLKPHVTGQRVLLARANRGRELLRDELAKVATVDQIAVYDQVDVTTSSVTVLDALRRGEIRYVTLPSSNIARGVIGSFDETVRGRVERGDIRLVAISPETGNAVRTLGLPVAAEAKTFTEDGLIQAVVELARAESKH
ncbi:uroporphyrin-iii c-methyltransferase : Uroporphyrin-III C-methyltransferase OS=Singulisphaera acidiphila (strain ATCC BAA-1392 / DSM 18658 / VKM B-2454 / MOB10) GN=Sinac_6071 PE=3 SV=1: TP_methylase: HEM4 [Gemmata massiliana]|uniref:uroporphyrinogen-III C-methyltransferase n=1 Tax=Gemmata massiliana TaxID=1210884 RepID=A0A6P2CZM8_9BACT|nr:uroporphyrinogen-III C-methyltransferase [Gemmata massiliana]VTR94303.1 uroporphyrin-iii c-methyltransferase : Uroporphyrin-III C-methyltransferase OS=Singulisphaera acidiphila (strain ATCC BAA-1392 / DSM 18658 / VKM B-2454 / MOB10) GN=Sinac_6071 PE=3 SV=1: TP_methylase: HEM4 [Gemmata massiliana]